MTAATPRGALFKKGQSGNPSGRPKGARNATTMAVERLLDGEAKAITRKAIDMAKGGDTTALRLCMDRICPPRKDRPVTFGLPPVVSAIDASAALTALLAAVGTGDLTPGEAGEIAKLLDSQIRAIEATELEERLSKLERMMSQ